MKKQYLFILAGVGAILAGSALLASSPKISNEMSRSYWNFTHGGIMDLRRQSIDMFAGCNSKSMMELTVDQGMTNIWQKESEEYHFDAIDVDRYMTNHCPSRTSEEVRTESEKYYTSYNEFLRGKGRPEISQEEQEKEIERAIQKEIVVSAYQKKFLNREFTALKDEPKE